MSTVRIYVGYYANVYDYQGKTHIYGWHRTRAKALSATPHAGANRRLNSRVRLKALKW